jgi:hypothetical protein
LLTGMGFDVSLARPGRVDDQLEFVEPASPLSAPGAQEGGGDGALGPDIVIVVSSAAAFSPDLVGGDSGSEVAAAAQGGERARALEAQAATLVDRYGTNPRGMARDRLAADLPRLFPGHFTEGDRAFVASCLRNGGMSASYASELAGLLPP